MHNPLLAQLCAIGYDRLRHIEYIKSLGETSTCNFDIRLTQNTKTKCLEWVGGIYRDCRPEVRHYPNVFSAFSNWEEKEEDGMEPLQAVLNELVGREDEPGLSADRIERIVTFVYDRTPWPQGALSPFDQATRECCAYGNCC